MQAAILDPTPLQTIRPNRFDHAVRFADIEQAMARLQDVVHRTPVLTSTMADRMTGAQLFFKCENFQRMGAFKMRGAYNAIAQFTPFQRPGGVLTFSSGNHAQAIALAARSLGVKATVLMPTDAPQAKKDATRDYGAEIIFHDRYTQDAGVLAPMLAQERGMTLIPPFDHPHVIAGQGTAALELFEQAGELDMLLVPTGGGGLLAGSALTAAAMSPGCAVIGVEPETGNDAQQSLRKGEIVTIATPKTIADAAQSRCVGRYTFPLIQRLVTDIATVSDAELVETMRFFSSRMKMIVEATGCLGAAAAFGGRVDVRGKRVGIIVSGGNVDLLQFAALISGQNT